MPLKDAYGAENSVDTDQTASTGMSKKLEN